MDERNIQQLIDEIESMRPVYEAAVDIYDENKQGLWKDRNEIRWNSRDGVLLDDLMDACRKAWEGECKADGDTLPDGDTSADKEETT